MAVFGEHDMRLACDAGADDVRMLLFLLLLLFAVVVVAVDDDDEEPPIDTRDSRCASVSPSISIASFCYTQK